ncbi:cotranscriptional regulator FAM172A [Galendromus occidentalis]|uniref:Cotranscriptional regulator FAM172A n=1 Tax=Galendromus occidentalis TaxID=34638 RepID=A0AAJ6VVX7_9ACAR|nr:cotranscriptional regulator FAM172A [Galendromus occidentalis]
MSRLNRLAWVFSEVLVTFLTLKLPFKDNSGYMEPEFPSTLEGFGYRFNDRGRLRSIQTGKPFEFAVSTDAVYNQRRYEALGQVLDQYVYDLLLKEGLEQVNIPVDHKGDAPSTFIFQSHDALSNTQKLLIIIHGSGVVRAGQWARRLIIGDSLQRGTQIGYIRRAIALGYGVLVLNPNDNSRDGVPIRSSSSPEEHALHVWDEIVSKAVARHVAIVAHSYGGVVTMNLLASRPEAINRIMAIAFTDSVHFPPPASILNDVREIAKNWRISDRPLDSLLTQQPNDIASVSAGTTEHTLTSWMAFASVFDFLEDMYMKTIALEGSS